MDVRERVLGYKDELIERLGKLVSVKSVEGEPLPDAPFGAGPRDALLTALDMLEKDGFKTVNLDNYSGYAEMGEGDQVIGIVGHLDVVPANKEDGWDTDPFQMVEKDGILYGRGVSDDKGAVAASMIAMKIIRDMNVPMHKRVRLIMGTNEETGSKGIAYYVKKEGVVDMGFTPDADFPCVHGEKGMVAAVYRSKSTKLLDIKGGTAKNIVCGKCSAVLVKNSFSGKKLEDYFNNNNIEYTLEDKEGNIAVTVFGKTAHASTPELGVNAISWLLTGLKAAGLQDPFVDFYCSRIGLETNGAGLGCDFSDEYGALTLNCGMIQMKNGVIEGTIDIRFPVTMRAKKIVKAMEERKETDGGVVEVLNTIEPLFYPVDSPLVKSLLEAYQEVTGDTESKPLTMGGGTYAKEMKNTIAFGCAFPGKDYRIHNSNEWCPVEDLLKQVEIYVGGILKLLNV